MSFDARRRVVGAVLLAVVALFAGAVVLLARSVSDEAVAAPAPAPAVVGPRYTPTAADLARRPTRPGPDTPLVALTFDDGPSPERTPWVLDVLKAKGVRATFFLQGDHSAAHPELVRRIRDEGHVIGNHSWDHPTFPEIDPRETEEQITRTEDLLTEITGTRPALFRYPHGESSPAGDAVLRRQGLTGGVLWHWESDLVGDFACPGAAGVENFVDTEAEDGALLLLHDAADVLACPATQWDYLPRSIDRLRTRGFGFGVAVPARTPSALNEGSRVAVVAPR